jgi:ATP adenylyltransferase
VDPDSHCDPLLAAIAARRRSALASGALQPLPTTTTELVTGDLVFVIRVLAPQARPHRAFQPTPPGFNPFLPHDPELFVTDLSPTHVGLLNKFPVVDLHLLMVTRAFAPQEGLLTPADLLAMSRCLSAFDGLAFYNAGTAAGASQRHRHLQYVPLTVATGGHGAPLEPVLTVALQGDAVVQSHHLPFAHALVALGSTDAAALEIAQHRLTTALAMPPTAPHNLLATRRWMLLVPRHQERWEGFGVNAMGFAGALLVRDAAALARLQVDGPLAVLRGVGLPPRPLLPDR